MWWNHNNYMWEEQYNEHTFYKNRNDTVILISRRIRDFFLKHCPYGFSIDNNTLGQLAQKCLKKGNVIVKYK